MFSLLNQIRTTVGNRLAYHRTVAALSDLPVDTALDLDIYKGDVRQIAHDAVYGPAAARRTVRAATPRLRFLSLDGRA